MQEIDRKLIFDLGAHSGIDTAHYLSRGFKVVAVEANPQLARKLKRRGADGRLIIEARALSSSANPISLHLPVQLTSDVWGTTSPQQAKMLHEVGVVTHEIQVPTVSLETLIQTHGVPYYIKCDIEGSDTEFLEMLADCASQPETISFELTQVGPAALEAQLRALQRCEFSRFQLRDQRLIPPSPEGMWSGPFGSDIEDQRMLTFGQLRRRARAALARSRLMGEFGLAGQLRLCGLIRRLAKVPLLGKLFYSTWYDVHCFR